MEINIEYTRVSINYIWSKIYQEAILIINFEIYEFPASWKDGKKVVID